MKLSVGLANAREGRQNPFGSIKPAELTQFAIEADRMGFHAVWANEAVTTHPKLKYSPTPPVMLEPLVTLAVIAGSTSRIRLVVSTVALPLHEPLNLAHEVASLDQLSGGRFVLGIGLGGREQYKQLRALSGPIHRGNMLEEQLTLMRRLWTEDEVSFKGDYFAVDDVTLYPKPVQTPLPVFEAGKAAAVLERAARWTQGWIDSAHDAGAIKAKVERLKELTEAAGRSWAEMSVARQFYASLGSTVELAQENAAVSDPSPEASFGFSGPGMEAQLIGTPEQVLERLAAYQAAGVTETCLIFYYANHSAALRQLELAARDILPHVESL